jgi:hypothetical protein
MNEMTRDAFRRKVEMALECDLKNLADHALIDVEYALKQLAGCTGNKFDGIKDMDRRQRAMDALERAKEALENVK